ncbi:unnamed protein product [Chondrus crispus]|uniref:Uncharacterized protein n=1 Tax=Chondrus crispus TaxID=2769 RepID=R7QSW3_CHOCR|nr:unnamed protein product [Chondrus crispus]CDF41229.1 unnamed protein product [Chondrus crispus]|eukprot:XP_005711523.1 unnamed protein product [Chondrus crispus]
MTFGDVLTRLRTTTQRFLDHTRSVPSSHQHTTLASVPRRPWHRTKLLAPAAISHRRNEQFYRLPPFPTNRSNTKELVHPALLSLRAHLVRLDGTR